MKTAVKIFLLCFISISLTGISYGLKGPCMIGITTSGSANSTLPLPGGGHQDITTSYTDYGNDVCGNVNEDDCVQTFGHLSNITTITTTIYDANGNFVNTTTNVIRAYNRMSC